jgi:GNAT superfamily N-acetyltransferase
LAEYRFELDPELDDSLTRSLVELWVDVTNAGGAVGFVPPVDKEDVAEVADHAFERVRRRQDHIVIGFEGEAPFGFAFLDHRPGPLFRHWVTLKRLMVRPHEQGAGRGRALLAAIHEKAHELGLEQVHLTVRGGTGTESFYERQGYEIHARIPGVIRVGPGDDREEIYMVKRLGDPNS